MKKINLAKTIFLANIVFGMSLLNNALVMAEGDFSPNVTEFYSKATSYFNSGDYVDAAKLFSQVLRFDPSNPEARNNLAGCYVNLGVAALENKSYDNAANYYRVALFYLKYDEDIHPNEHLLQNIDIAEANLKSVLLKEHEKGATPLEHYNLAKALRGKGSFREAVVEFNAALPEQSVQLDSYVNLGDIMHVLQKETKAVEYYVKALDLSPKDAALHLKLARSLQKLDNIDAAVKEYDIAATLTPDNKDISSALESLWRRKIQQNPEDAVAHMNLGVMLQKKNDLQGAMAEYTLSQQINPDNPTLRLNIGTLFQAEGKYTTAIKAYDSIIAVDPNNPMVHYYKATALRDMGNIQDSIAEFQTVLNLEPNNDEAKKSIILTIKKSNDPSVALTMLQQIATANPNDAFAQYSYAYELHLQKHFKEAIEFYQKAYDLDKSYDDSMLNIASIYRDQNDNDKAIAVLEGLLNANPNDQKAKNLISQLKENSRVQSYQQAIDLQSKGNYKEAIEGYKKVIADGKADSDLYFNMASSYQALNDIDNAISAYEKSIELDKNNSSSLYYLGTAYYIKKNYQKAQDCYNKALALDPNNTDIKDSIKDVKVALLSNMIDKGVNELNAQRYTKALEIFNNAISSNPSNPYAYYYRGMTYDSLNKTSFAITDYKKAIEKSIDVIDVYYNLAVDYDLIKNKAEAKKAYELFVSKSTNKNNQYVKYAKQRINAIK